MTHNLFRWRGVVFGVSLSLCTVLSGCHDYTVIAPTAEPEALYFGLQANHRAVLLSKEAPYDTLQLTVVPVNVNGDPIEPDPQTVSPIAWESSDTTAVAVSPTGLLSARKVTTRVSVYATMSVGTLTRKDTIWVAVTETAPAMLDSLVLYVPTNRNVVATSGTLSFAVRARLEDGSPVAGVPVSYQVSNRWIANFKGTLGVLSGLTPLDSIYVFASSTVYGVTRRDSMRIYTGYPVRVLFSTFVLEALVSSAGTLEYVPRFIDPGSAPGSSFIFRNPSGSQPKNAVDFPAGGMDVDIIFDHPELVDAFLPASPLPMYNQGGNILGLAFGGEALSQIAYRKFTQVGEHWYTVEPLGVRGKVTIGER